MFSQRNNPYCDKLSILLHKYIYFLWEIQEIVKNNLPLNSNCYIEERNLVLLNYKSL
jgi:hypothetical protein